MRPKASIGIAVACAAALLAGCGGGRGDDAETPAACLEGSTAYVKALAAAPGKVALAGETPIGECLTENQGGGDLATVGEALVSAATELNAEAREDPGGQATLELGYLVGAVKRGADGTEGIHTDLIRRLVVAARFAPGDDPLSPAFMATYEEGFDAGRAGGWLVDS